MEANARLEEGVRAGNLRMVREALRRGADPNWRIGGAETALYRGVLSGREEVVKALLAAGARPGREPSGSTCVHVAAAGGKVGILRMLLKAGGRRLINRFDEMERTALICAVEGGSVEAVRELLEAGADVNACSGGKVGNTALRCAAGEGTLEMVKLLVGAGADPLIPGRLMLTALDRARERRTPEGRLITAFLTRTLESAAAAKKQPRKRPSRRRALQKR